jgi:dihydrofolate reductase
MEWATPFFGEEAVEHAYGKAGEADYFLLGRRTYEMFAAKWPGLGGKYMDRMNGLRKLVASRTLTTATWNAEVIQGDVAGAITRLKREPGGTILKYGLTQLDQTLLSAGLIDEFQLSIIPTRVGGGKRAFDDIDPTLLKLELVDTHRFGNGVVLLTYVPR